MKKSFKTKGMHCKSCEILVEDAISEITGVSHVKANHSKNSVEVEFEPPASETQIKKAIEKEGYAVLS
ncbi:MAG: heavy-metal-associated domain-containing protein [Candidatus Norongarragalinales archaeon]